MGRTASSICVLVLLLTSGTSDGISAKEDITIAVVGDQQVVGKPFAVRIRNNGEKRLTFCLGVCGELVVAGSGHAAPAFAVVSASSFESVAHSDDIFPTSTIRVTEGEFRDIRHLAR